MGKGDDYITVVSDSGESTVEYIADDRKKESLNSFFEGLSQEQIEGIEAVAMDIWDPYIASVLAQVLDAQDKIVFDRYHLMMHKGKAVDEVWKEEHRALRKVGDETLTYSNYLWLYSWENLLEKHEERFAVLKDRKLRLPVRRPLKRVSGIFWVIFAYGGLSTILESGTFGRLIRVWALLLKGPECSAKIFTIFLPIILIRLPTL